MATDLELYQRLNTELVSLVDHFSNLVKATREGAPSGPGACHTVSAEQQVFNTAGLRFGCVVRWQPSASLCTSW